MRWPVVRLIAAREIRDQTPRSPHALPHPRPARTHVPALRGCGVTVRRGDQGEETHRSAWSAPSTCPRPSPSVAPVAGAAGRACPDRAARFPRFSSTTSSPKTTSPPIPMAASSSSRTLPPPMRSSSRRGEVDAILVIDPDLAAKLERGEKPTVRVLAREGEENSKIAVRRLTGVLRLWIDEVRSVRFVRAGLPATSTCPSRSRTRSRTSPTRRRCSTSFATCS